MADPSELEPPEPRLVYRRYISPARLQYAEEAHEILQEHGLVRGTTVYRARHQARWRAQALIKLLTDDMEMYERWQLAEHTHPRDGGWVWTVEYKGRRPA